jgi:hypothetical protein
MNCCKNNKPDSKTSDYSYLIILILFILLAIIIGGNTI